jgi:thiamine biosynthesis lipoprotein
MVSRSRWLCVLLIACPPGCRDRATPSELVPRKGSWFEARRTVYGRIPARVKLWLPARRRGEAGAIKAACWAELDRLGRVFNAFSPASEIGRLNARPTARPVTISKDLAAALRVARRVHAASGGAFDPTVWPLKRLWRRAAARRRLPTDEELDEALAGVGLAHLRVDGDPPRLTRAIAGVQLDLGGVAKGYAVDRLGRLLRARGVTAALVQLGGEVLAFGRSDVGPWRLGVQHPTARGQVYGVVEHRGTVRVSTSGNYEQPVRIGGKTYYHVFVPTTGRPASTRVRGVTVASFDGGPDSATLDAAATAAVVTGARRATKLVRALGGEALVIEGATDALREAVTPGFAARWRRRARERQ